MVYVLCCVLSWEIYVKAYFNYTKSHTDSVEHAEIYFLPMQTIFLSLFFLGCILTYSLIELLENTKLLAFYYKLE